MSHWIRPGLKACPIEGRSRITHALSVGEFRKGHPVAMCGIVLCGLHRFVLEPNCPDCRRVLLAEKRLRMMEGT